MPLYDIFASIDYPPLQAGLKGEPGQSARFMASLRYPLDQILEKQRQANASAQGDGDPSTLVPLGSDRGIPQGFAEPLPTYRARLKAWLTGRPWQGMARGILQQVVGYLAPYAPAVTTVDNQGTWIHYAAGADVTQPPVVTKTAPNDWNWDGSDPADGTRWFRLWPIVDGSAWVSPSWVCGAAGVKCGNFTKSCGLSLPPYVWSTLTTIIKAWKGAHSRCPAPIINLDPTNLFKVAAAAGDPSLPNGTFKYPAKYVGGVCVPARFANARFLSEVN